MALNTFKCNCLTPLHFKGLIVLYSCPLFWCADIDVNVTVSSSWYTQWLPVVELRLLSNWFIVGLLLLWFIYWSRVVIFISYTSICTTLLLHSKLSEICLVPGAVTQYMLDLSKLLVGLAFESWSDQKIWFKASSACCFEITFSDRLEGSLVSCIICDCMWHLTSNPWVVKLSWLENAYSRRVLLTGYLDQ